MLMKIHHGIGKKLNLREGLGFKYLTHQEQNAYKIILKAFSSISSYFDCSQINPGIEIMKVIHTVLGDNPSIIYFNKTQIQIEKSMFGKKCLLTGIHSKSQVEIMNKDLKETSNKIITFVKEKSTDEYSLLINLYNALQKNIRYNTEEIQANAKGTSISPASHNAYGAIINKKAVCDGFSSAFALLAKKLGFDCMLVVGNSAYSSTSFTNHAWNIIKIQEKFYHIDVTWDARKFNDFKQFSYSYFALKDEEIANDHKWDKNTTPACSYNDFSFYFKNGLYADNETQLNDIIKTYCDNQLKIFRFKLSRNISLPNNTGDYLAQKILNNIKITGRIQISHSWNEHTRCFFGKIVS